MHVHSNTYGILYTLCEVLNEVPTLIGYPSTLDDHLRGEERAWERGCHLFTLLTFQKHQSFLTDPKRPSKSNFFTNSTNCLCNQLPTLSTKFQFETLLVVFYACWTTNKVKFFLRDISSMSNVSPPPPSPPPQH